MVLGGWVLRFGWFLLLLLAGGFGCSVVWFGWLGGCAILAGFGLLVGFGCFGVFWVFGGLFELVFGGFGFAEFCGFC